MCGPVGAHPARGFRRPLYHRDNFQQTLDLRDFCCARSECAERGSRRQLSCSPPPASHSGWRHESHSTCWSLCLRCRQLAPAPRGHLANHGFSPSKRRTMANKVTSMPQLFRSHGYHQVSPHHSLFQFQGHLQPVPSPSRVPSPGFSHSHSSPGPLFALLSWRGCPAQ